MLGPIAIVREHDRRYGRDDHPEYRKADLESHANAVGIEAAWIGEELGLPRKICYLLFLAGILHDLGKTVMVEYLQKAPFSPEQKQRKRKHAAISSEMFAEHLEQVADLRVRAALQELLIPIEYHHEPWKAVKIDDYRAILALILHLADIYCALMEDRGLGHGPRTPEEAIAILEKQVAEWPEYAVFETLPRQIVAALRRLHLERQLAMSA
jgi:HD-GYP domain-containing protein (c-di-GMP phosphodiesterase class II)